MDLARVLFAAAFAIAVALPLPFSAAPSAPQTDSLASDRVVGTLGARLDSQLTRFAEYGFWGTVLVVRDGHLVLLKAYGLADADRAIPNAAATRFELNSMTKMFTGVAILQLDAAGRLQVGDPVDRALGAFPAGKRGATIEQLASHTAGLIVEGSELAEGSREAFVCDVKRTPRESPPGERYRYTNAGFSLLAAIIEVVSGESYETYLQHHLFGPAGMTSAMFRDQVPTHDPRYAHGYVGTPAGLEHGPPNPYGWGTRGAGGVWATVGDVYRWIVAVEHDNLLPQAQRRMLFSPTPPFARGVRMARRDDRARQGRDSGGGSDDFASHPATTCRDHLGDQQPAAAVAPDPESHAPGHRLR